MNIKTRQEAVNHLLKLWQDKMVEGNIKEAKIYARAHSIALRDFEACKKLLSQRKVA